MASNFQIITHMDAHAHRAVTAIVGVDSVRLLNCFEQMAQKDGFFDAVHVQCRPVMTGSGPFEETPHLDFRVDYVRYEGAHKNMMRITALEASVYVPKDAPAFIKIDSLHAKDWDRGHGREALKSLYHTVKEWEGMGLKLDSWRLFAGLNIGAYFWGRAGFVPVNPEGEFHVMKPFLMVDFRLKNIFAAASKPADKETLRAVHQDWQILVEQPSVTGFYTLMDDRRALQSGAPVIKTVFTHQMSYVRDQWLNHALASGLHDTAWGYQARLLCTNQKAMKRFEGYVVNAPRGRSVLDILPPLFSKNRP